MLSSNFIIKRKDSRLISKKSVDGKVTTEEAEKEAKEEIKQELKVVKNNKRIFSFSVVTLPQGKGGTYNG